ncbi:MAG: choice-of-anchor D domain-containing protein [bacterium]|nr:choice-of-anchor D domain-containing protein [bacterium]
MQAAFDWKDSLNLTFPVLADPLEVVADSFAFYGFPFYPWDVIVGANDTLAYTENSYAGQIWRLDEIEHILDSLFTPEIAANPNSLNFDEVEVGQSADLTFWIDNAGTGVLQINDVTASLPQFGASPLQALIYARDDSIQITVTFTPTQVANYNGTLSIISPQDTLEVGVSGIGTQVGVEPEKQMPKNFQISCYPNPFNAVLGIKVTLETSQQIKVTLHNLAGSLQSQIWSGPLSAGSHELRWSDQQAPSGLYLLKVTGEGWSRVQKVVLIR